MAANGNKTGARVNTPPRWSSPSSAAVAALQYILASVTCVPEGRYPCWRCNPLFPLPCVLTAPFTCPLRLEVRHDRLFPGCPLQHWRGRRESSLVASYSLVVDLFYVRRLCALVCLQKYLNTDQDFLAINNDFYFLNLVGFDSPGRCQRLDLFIKVISVLCCYLTDVP